MHQDLGFENRPLRDPEFLKKNTKSLIFSGLMENPIVGKKLKS